MTTAGAIGLESRRTWPRNPGSIVVRVSPCLPGKSYTIVSVFVDTNVLVSVRDRSEAEKQRRAAEWMGSLWETGIGKRAGDGAGRDITHQLLSSRAGRA